MSCGGCCKQDAAEASATKQCCICHPYQDAYLMTAQILSIIALLMSWVWWVTFILAFPAMIALQVVWCCKMKKPGLKSVLVLSLLSAIGSVFAGIWMLVKWKNQKWCSVFTVTMTYDDDSFPDSDYCNEGAWAIVSFVNAALFFATAYFMYLFVFQNFDEIVAKEANRNNDLESPNAIELGTVSSMAAAAPTIASGLDEPAVATATYYIPSDGEKSENTGY